VDRVPLGRKHETELAMGRRWSTWLWCWDALYVCICTHVSYIMTCYIVKLFHLRNLQRHRHLPYLQHFVCTYHMPAVCISLDSCTWRIGHCTATLDPSRPSAAVPQFYRCRPAAKLFAEFPLAPPIRRMKSVELDMVSSDSVCTECI
jgi:hypothetical protein